MLSGQPESNGSEDFMIFFEFFKVFSGLSFVKWDLILNLL